MLYKYFYYYGKTWCLWPFCSLDLHMDGDPWLLIQTDPLDRASKRSLFCSSILMLEVHIAPYTSPILGFFWFFLISVQIFNACIKIMTWICLRFKPHRTNMNSVKRKLKHWHNEPVTSSSKIQIDSVCWSMSWGCPWTFDVKHNINCVIKSDIKYDQKFVLMTDLKKQTPEWMIPFSRFGFNRL